MRPSFAARQRRESAPIFAALGDETRLFVLARLCKDGPLSIANIAADAEVSRQAVTKHLRVLASAGLVRGSRSGRESVWWLEPRGFEPSRAFLDIISQEWDRTLERLKAFVEAE
jgi:DNA-binding transcriptional ArsR family regulator